MGKKILTDLLILGSAATGLTLLVQTGELPAPFFLALASVNLGTALFLLLVVRPLLRGRVTQAPQALVHGATLVLLGGWAATFWIEYAQVSHLPSALVGALTWTAATLVYVGDALGHALAPAPGQVDAGEERAPATVGAGAEAQA